MRLFKFKPFSGPKHFCFKDPDTGFEYLETTERDLIRRIASYRAQNRLTPITHLDIVLQNYWCSLKENQGECEPCAVLKRGLLAYVRGGIALIDNLWYGAAARVSQEEADRRAKICIDCVYNVFPDKDAFVAWSDMIAEHSVGTSKSKYHDQLGNCEVCTCTLKAKVFYKGDMGLTEEQKDKMIKVGCWQVNGEDKNGRTA